MLEKIKAETKFSNFEYSGWFVEPVFEPFRLYSSLSSIYSGLKPLNVSALDVKYHGGASTPTDTLVSFQMAKKNYALNLSLAGFTFKADFVDWSQAPIITNIIETTLKALCESLKTGMASHQLQISMQLVIPGTSLREFTRSFTPFLRRPSGDEEFSGFTLHTKTGLFVVDKSVVHEDGIFVRVLRKFEGQSDMTQMAKVLFDEESWLAATLGIEIV